MRWWLWRKGSGTRNDLTEPNQATHRLRIDRSCTKTRHVGLVMSRWLMARIIRRLLLALLEPWLWCGSDHGLCWCVLCWTGTGQFQFEKRAKGNERAGNGENGDDAQRRPPSRSQQLVGEAMSLSGLIQWRRRFAVHYKQFHPCQNKLPARSQEFRLIIFVAPNACDGREPRTFTASLTTLVNPPNARIPPLSQL